MGLFDLGLRKKKDSPSEEKGEPQSKPDPDDLGTGYLRNAAQKIKDRPTQLKMQECEAMGGRWNSEAGSCSYPGSKNPSLD